MRRRRIGLPAAVRLLAGIALALAAAGSQLIGGTEMAPSPIDSSTQPLFIGPVEVTGLGEDEAAERLAARLSPVLRATVVLAAGGEEIRLSSLEELGIAPLVAESVRLALAGGEAAGLSGAMHRSGRLPRAENPPDPGSSGDSKARTVYFAGGLIWHVDETRLRERLKELGARVFRPPANATIRGDGSIEPHRPGRKLDVEVGASSVVAALDGWSEGWGAAGGGAGDERAGEQKAGDEIRFELPVLADPPAVTAEKLGRLAASAAGLGGTLLTGFTTYYDERMEGRAANVRLAAAFIDGVVLLPGESFSFNETVGPRLVERGFRPAPEIVGEEFVEGIGGGICQVSSTLYNAVLYADLKVLERYRHSVPLGYVPPGRDATLQYGVMDFRFQNTLSEPVVIRAEAGGGRLRVSLWGRKPLPYDVSLSSEQVEVPFREVVEFDPKLPAGERRVDEPGEPGRWIIVYKVVRDEATGLETPAQVVSRNYYPPKARRIRTGAPFFTAGGSAGASEREQATPREGAPPAAGIS